MGSLASTVFATFSHLAVSSSPREPLTILKTLKRWAGWETARTSWSIRSLHVGIEHIAIETDDYAGTLANIKKNGAQILEERVNNGRHVCWVAAPDGAQMELIEKV